MKLAIVFFTILATFSANLFAYDRVDWEKIKWVKFRLYIEVPEYNNENKHWDTPYVFDKNGNPDLFITTVSGPNNDVYHSDKYENKEFDLWKIKCFNKTKCHSLLKVSSDEFRLSIINANIQKPNEIMVELNCNLSDGYCEGDDYQITNFEIISSSE